MQAQYPDCHIRYYDREPLTAVEWQKLLGDRPVEHFLNPRSGSYKDLGLAGRKISRAEFIRLVQRDSNLLRRPLVVKGNRYVFGLDSGAYAEL